MDIAAVGYVKSISEAIPIATFGSIGSLWRAVPGDILKIQIDASITNGLSGGAIFNQYGELIGMIQSFSPTFDGWVLALSYLEINEVLEALRFSSND